MGDLDDLIERIRRRPPEARFADVERLMVAFGWRLRRPAKGSHRVFEKPGELPISVPTKHGRTVSRIYLNDICRRLGLDEVPSEE